MVRSIVISAVVAMVVSTIVFGIQVQAHQDEAERVRTWQSWRINDLERRVWHLEHPGN